MSRPSSPLFSSLLLSAICIAVIGSSCSKGTEGSGGPGAMAPGTGGIAFRLVWQQPSSKAKGLSQYTPSFNACVDYGIGTIAATVSGATTTDISGSWPCSAHEGLIFGVPAGSNYTVQVSGIASGPTTTTWSGQISAITVNPDQITNAGTIVMGYIGGDIIPPTASITLHSNPTITTNIPITDRIIIAFDEPMAISGITTTNIKLNLADNSPVPGSVNYDGASNTATFIPSATLLYDTQYVLQVISSCTAGTSCITDLAGNSLASDYTNTFTTESALGGVPNAPSGVTAKPGNGQVTLDWLASSGSTSYNIYYSLISGSTGTQIPDARAPFVHLGLTNGQTYYYTVTAVNGSGESLASAEVSTTPVFPAGDPLPPALLAVTFNSGQNSVTWTPVTGATTYNLYWSTTPIIPDKYAADHVIRNVTSPIVHTGLTDGLPYCYIVTAMNSNGESADSMQVCGGIGAIQLIW